MYSAFDLLAGAGTNFLLNLSITAVVPMVLSSAERRGHADPLSGSGSVVGATSIGMVVSVIAMYQWSERLLDGKTPFYLFAALLIAGNATFLLAEIFHMPLDVLLAARVLMSLGFGAGFAAKRRAGQEAAPQEREYHFLRLELANSLGMAGGPILSGGLSNIVPDLAAFVPPALISALALVFLVVLALTPLDAPLAAAHRGPHEATPLVPPHSQPFESCGTMTEVHGAGTASSGPSSKAGMGAHGGQARGADGDQVPSSSSYGGGSESDGRHGMIESVTVQVAMLLFGMSRNFLKFGFESAMVVVYDRQFYFSQGSSGVIAGCCALSTVASLFIYKSYCARAMGTHRLLLVAEAFGLLSALLMMLSDHAAFSPSAPVSLATAATMTREHRGDDARAYAELLTIAASILFYPAMYFGAAIGNSHPLRYAVSGHPLLSRPSMLAQQEILQKTIGKGLGMLYCRVALGDPPRLAALGRLFFAVMAAQAVLLAFTFEPAHTAQQARRALQACRKLMPSSRSRSEEGAGSV